MTAGIDRRAFLRGALTLSGSLALGRAEALALLGRGARRSESPRKVLILGAGVAGLAAGLKLRELGHEVVILEARARPGGRVYTLRAPFSDGLYAEAGAGRIPSTHALTLAYVERFKLSLDPFYPEAGNEVLCWKGTRVVVPRGGEADLTTLRVSFTPRERAVGLGGLSKLYVDEFREQLRALPVDGYPFPKLDRYEGTSFGDFLRKQGASADAIAYLSQGFEDDSLLDFVHDALSHAVPKLWKIRGGNDLLPRAMAEPLSSQIRYGAEVRRIEQHAGGVRVTFTTGRASHVENADRLICTIPFSVLRHIDIAPALSAGKADAIRKFYMGPVARVFLQTRRRFWEDQGLNGFATVDQPMELWSPTYNEPGRRGILMSYIYETLAREYSGLPEEAQIERTLDIFEQAHPGTREHFETATTWSWLNEPYSQGAFTVTRAGEFDLLRQAGTIEGRLHFAGEHTSPWPAWIQGGLHSGLRAAREVNDAG